MEFTEMVEVVEVIRDIECKQIIFDNDVVFYIAANTQFYNKRAGIPNCHKIIRSVAKMEKELLVKREMAQEIALQCLKLNSIGDRMQGGNGPAAWFSIDAHVGSLLFG